MKQQKQNVIFTALTALIVAIAVLFMLFLIFDWEIQYKKHATWEHDGIRVTLKGNRKQIRQIRISGDAIQSCRLPFSADADLADSDAAQTLLLYDVNFDSHADLLVLCADDADGDLHHAVYLFHADQNTFVAPEQPLSLANLTYNEDTQSISTHQTFRTTLAKATEYAPEIYEECREAMRYGMIDGVLSPTYRCSLTYYSESDIYCYAVYEYDAEYGELSCKTEKWLEADDVENIEIG